MSLGTIISDFLSPATLTMAMQRIGIMGGETFAVMKENPIRIVVCWRPDGLGPSESPETISEVMPMPVLMGLRTIPDDRTQWGEKDFAALAAIGGTLQLLGDKILKSINGIEVDAPP